MEFINISNPVTVLLILVIAIFLIFLGKTTKKSFIPAILLFVFLALLVYYVVCLQNPELSAERGVIFNCMAINFTFIFIAFLSYLWVDDIESKIKNKKSIDDSLSWFWDKI